MLINKQTIKKGKHWCTQIANTTGATSIHYLWRLLIKLFDLHRQTKYVFIKLPYWFVSFQEEERDKKEMLFVYLVLDYAVSLVNKELCDICAHKW
jgi:hypothetical protein